ncbi:MAG: alpha/beta hydrolase [Synechococcales bacterium]|nr:alpha/beta hydrolase [Synechococcales bacterium]
MLLLSQYFRSLQSRSPLMVPTGWVPDRWEPNGLVNPSKGGIGLKAMALRLLTSLGLGGMVALGWNPDAQAAERIYLSYGILERSISYQALADYAQNGKLDDDLAVYTSYVSPEQRGLLQGLLRSRAADLSPIAISQFLYSPQGEILLKRLGTVIQLETRESGFYGIRAALILAASDPQGLTPLNVIRKFPTRGIRIDLLRTLQVAGELENLITQTTLASAAIADQVNLEATLSPGPDNWPDLQQRGRQGRTVERLTLIDRDRPDPLTGFAVVREFPVDLYLPTGLLRSPDRRQVDRLPLVVISHGLGSDRKTFAYLAEHLATHGFAVAVPEHPGSNTKQMQNLIRGLAKEVAQPSEFINRPRDIRYLLDELQRRSLTDPRLRQINFNQVGVVGQSFGGYTALALAGAPFNFDRLQRTCTEQNQVNTYNISLLLQCRAQELPNRHYELADPRVAAILTINPISGTVLGPESLRQIQIPTLVISGNADTVAPAVPEQLQPFTWLQTPDRYLVMVDRGTHFSFLADVNASSSPDSLPIPPELIGPNPALARRYLNALGLAFFRTHLLKQGASRQFLTPAYGRAIASDPLRLDILQELGPEVVKQGRLDKPN